MLSRRARAKALHPGQFKVNEAWIGFQLSNAPFETEEGHGNCLSLMDAASGYLFGIVLESAEAPEGSAMELRRLFERAREQAKHYPEQLFVPAGRLQAAFSPEAERLGIPVLPVAEDELRALIGDAQREFRKAFEDGDR